MKKPLLERIARLTLLLIFSLFSFTGMAQAEIEGDAANGKSLFNSNCASCHKLDKKAIGPALGGVTQKQDLQWLIQWISNNQEMRASGDPQAIAIFNEFNGSIMPAFPGLSEQDIKDILVYTVEGSKPQEETAGTPNDVAGTGETPGGGSDNTMLLLALAAVLVGLIFLLARVKNTLKEVKGEPTSSVAEEAGAITRTALKNPRIVTLLVIFIAVIFLQQLYVALMAVGVTQEYQPEQPIAFSHKIHAGENAIDCNYCHYGARKGKQSNIPSAGVCMNCHMYITEGPKTGTEEISKIYASVGWDPENSQYIEGYQQKPIKWIRIHNLPDLAYFNHAQHVTVGQVACQTCHGPIQEMEEVYQYAPLTMGWCINCHRETEVQTKSNDYYTEMHEKLKDKYGEDASITVEMIGGLECGKCHY